MKGFKSFASPTILEFGTGINAIVGPNGSGKSNIIEAIRWALGEQSARQLRGDKMQDIIFSGTQSRRAMNQAYVTLILDNTDRTLAIQSDEVTITRRLNRQNESEFELNGQACRLKDILNLMTDSGIGKQSLSIISQGKVEEIFEQKPEQRRALFEEAAGILKYKQRKQETQKKLSETDEHLDRLDDVLYELERQLLPLEAQAQTAKKYKSITSQLSALEISVNVHEISQALSQRETLTAKQKESLLQLQDHKRKAETLKKELELKKQAYEKQLEQLEAAQESYVGVSKRLEKEQAKRTLLEERQAHQKESQAQFQQQQLSIDSDLMDIVGQKAKVSQSIIEAKKSKKALSQQLKKINQSLETLEAVSETSVEHLREEYFEVMQQQAHVSNELQSLQQQFEKDCAKANRLNENQQAWAQQMTQLKEERETLELRKVEAQKRVTNYQKEQATLQASLTHLKEKQENKLQQGQQAKQQIDRLEAQIISAKQLLESRAYYFQGTREVLENKELEGIVGAVAEQIEVDAKFTTAIDVALGNRSQHLIVKNEQSAKAAIEYLKKHHKGQATFLPQTTIKAQQLEPRLKNTLEKESSFLGVASDLVKTKPSNKKIIDALLGTTGIVSNLDEGLKLAKKVNYQLKLVTLSGEILQKGGALTGGSQVKSGALLQQKEELNQKEEQLHILQETYQTFERKMASLSKESEDLTLQKEKVDDALQDAIIEYKQATKLLEATTTQWQQYERENHFMSKEVSNMLSEKDYQLQRQKLEDTKEALTVTLETLQKKTDAANQSEANRLAQKESLLKEIYDLKSKISVETERLKQLENEKNRLIKEEEKLTARKQALKEQIEVIENKDESWDFDTIEKNIERLLKDVEKKQLLIETLRKQGQKLQQELDTLEAQYHQTTQQWHQFELTSHRLEEKLSQLSQLLEEKLQFLSESYQLTYEKAEQQAEPIESLSESRQRIRHLKQEKNALGAVNMEAMQQYDDVKTRFDTMIAQRDDLMTAKSQLLETIGEMDIKVAERFKDTFEQISEAFSRLFPKMFGGGYAKILMTNPNDLLSTGVEIEVEPPGKKLKALSLLSGGERALTAITLLFAILEVKSVPFCILDEVEAALDEANVQRFGYYLKHFSTDQFIIITHRKGTMEMADALYGVTMEDAGVSTLVSVKLEDYD